jgi:type I restriction enzyme S subunit
MIDGLKPYPTYKDSGVAWLGEVPEHWGEAIKMKYVSSLKGRLGWQGLKANEYTTVGPYVVSSAHFRDYRIQWKRCPHVTPERYEMDTNIQLASEDILLMKDGAAMGKLAFIHELPSAACLNSHLLLFRPLGTNAGLTYLPKFMFYFMQTESFQDYVRVNGTGATFLGISQESLGNFKLCLPRISDQAAIVRFLDHADRLIRRYIRAKKRLIALLNEQKQVVIHEAVTRGLDLDGRLCPFRAEWLHYYPSNWDRLPLKRLLSRMDYGTSEAARPGGRVRILTMGNIQDAEVTAPPLLGLDDVPDELILEHHDLLFTRTNGNPDLVGKIGIFRGSRSDMVSFASYHVRLRVKEPHNPEWLHLLLSSTSFWRYARSHALVNLQTNLNSTRYSQFAIPVPPPREQSLILDHIVAVTPPLRHAIERAQKGIALLHEYRTRLIADVVTGKLDVRQAAAYLPDEAEEPEAVEESDELGHSYEEAEPMELEESVLET